MINSFLSRQRATVGTCLCPPLLSPLLSIVFAFEMKALRSLHHIHSKHISQNRVYAISPAGFSENDNFEDKLRSALAPSSVRIFSIWHYTVVLCPVTKLAWRRGPTKNVYLKVTSWDLRHVLEQTRAKGPVRLSLTQSASPSHGAIALGRLFSKWAVLPTSEWPLQQGHQTHSLSIMRGFFLIRLCTVLVGGFHETLHNIFYKKKKRSCLYMLCREVFWKCTSSLCFHWDHVMMELDNIGCHR